MKSKKGSMLQNIDPFFIPYACHVDHDTILTKNGNLLQTIKITGFDFELAGKEKLSLRKVLRDSIGGHLPDSSYALWIHTIRRKKDLSLSAQYENSFCASLHDKWESLHDWSGKFANELYVTILTEGKGYRISKSNNLSKVLNFPLLKGSEKKLIEYNLAKLTKVTNNILQDLSDFGAHKLSIVKNIKGVYHSEVLRFLGKIINLEEREVALAKEDLSHLLPYCKIAFGKNSLEVLDDDRKHFAAIFSVKEYTELSLNSLDSFLQLPIEFITTQTVDFINSKEALKDFKYQAEILEISDDKEFAKNSGINDILNADHHKETDYGEQQLTIMVIADGHKKLNSDIEKTVKTFYQYGLNLVREDIFMENCYWSQLPGNFSYISRRSAINTDRIAGFASLSNFPAGKRENNKWGDAVSVLYTKNKTPYFFNFHSKDNGHTMIIGPEGAGKTVLLNFLLSEAGKFNYKLFYIDIFNSSEIFIKSLGGEYYNLDIKNSQKLFNPCSLLTEDQSFFKLFLEYLMIQKSDISQGKYTPKQEKIDFIAKILQKITDDNVNLNKLGDLEPYFTDTKYAKIFSLWIKGGKLNSFFDNQEDLFANNCNYIGIDLTNLLKYKPILVPTMFYLMQKIENSLDGEPTIIILDEAFKLLDNPFLADKIHDWLARLRQKNAIVIFASESLDDAKNSNITKLLTNEIATQIFLPNPSAGKEYKEIFSLNKQEFRLLQSLSNTNRCFLLKHAEEAVVAELDLENLEELTAVLSSNETTIEIMYKVIAKVGSDINKWVPTFQEFIKDLIKEDAAIEEMSYQDGAEY